MLSDGAFASWTSPDRLDSARLDARFYSPDHLRLLNRLDVADVPRRPLGLLVEHLAHVTGYESSKHMDWVDDATGVRVVEAQNVGDMLLTGTEWKLISSSSYTQLNRHQLQVGDLVFTKDGTLGNCAYVTRRFLPAVASRHVFRIVPKSNVDGAYLTAWLCSQAGRIQTMHRQAGAVQGTIITPEVAQFAVLVPEPGIQRAIGNKVRKAERLRELATQAHSQVEQAIAHLFGNPDASQVPVRAFWASTVSSYRLNPGEYHPYALGVERELLAMEGGPLRQMLLNESDISGGATPRGATYQQHGVRFLRVQDLQPNRLEVDDVVFIDRRTDETLRRSRGHLHDVVLTITGYPGTACVVREHHLPLNMNQHCVRFHLNDQWNPFFVAAFLNSPWGKAQVNRRAIGGTRDALDYPSVLSILVPSASEASQAKIEALVIVFNDALDESKKLVDGAKNDAESLINGTLDEPALLAEGKSIEQWLAENPSPKEQEGP